MVRAAPGAGPAVKEDSRLSVGIAALFPIEAMAVANIDMAEAMRLDRRI
jgi:hypothetical protein